MYALYKHIYTYGYPIIIYIYIHHMMYMMYYIYPMIYIYIYIIITKTIIIYIHIYIYIFPASFTDAILWSSNVGNPPHRAMSVPPLEDPELMVAPVAKVQGTRGRNEADVFHRKWRF